MRLVLAAVALAGSLAAVGAALAEPAPVAIALVLKGHVFTPSAITAPAGQRIRIDLKNEDGVAEEFDSDDLHAEKDVGPHGHVVIDIGPLKPGVYSFMGELHAKTATGQLTVVAAQP